MFNPTLTCPKLIKESHTSVRDSSGGELRTPPSQKSREFAARLSVPVAIYSKLAVIALHHRKALLCRPSDV